jgi:hypothetical protein
MSVTVKNILPTTLDIPGDGLIFKPGEAKTVPEINEALSEAIRGGSLQVVSQVDGQVVVVDHDGQTEFTLPVVWGGPDRTKVTFCGVVLSFGEDFTVDIATNLFRWLDIEIVPRVGDKFVFIGRAS